MFKDKLKYILLGIILVVLMGIGLFIYDSLDGVSDIFKKTVNCDNQKSFISYPSKNTNLIFDGKRKGFENQIAVQNNDKSILMIRPKSQKDPNFLLNENPDPALLANIYSCFKDSKVTFNRYTTIEKTANSIQSCTYQKEQTEDKLFPFNCN
jgi:hypothetical protein